MQNDQQSQPQQPVLVGNNQHPNRNPVYGHSDDYLNQVILLLQNDPSMRLLDEEKQWAINLKQAVLEQQQQQQQQQASSSPSSSSPSSSLFAIDASLLTDFDYVQYAIATQGDIPQALYKIHGMQAFCREYGVNNTVQQGIECIQRVMTLLPGHVLHLDNCPDSNQGIIVWDCSVFYPAKIVEPCQHGAEYHWKTYIVATYYMKYLCQPTVASIREGVTVMLDCGQVEWENVCMDFERRMHEELRAFYPVRWKQILAYNTALIANVGWSLFKQFMNPHMRQRLKLGCQIMTEPYFNGANNLNDALEGPSRLRELFLQPSLEVAQRNIWSRAKDLLTIRTGNATHFKL